MNWWRITLILTGALDKYNIIPLIFFQKSCNFCAFRSVDSCVRFDKTNMLKSYVWCWFVVLFRTTSAIFLGCPVHVLVVPEERTTSIWNAAPKHSLCIIVHAYLRTVASDSQLMFERMREACLTLSSRRAYVRRHRKPSVWARGVSATPYRNMPIS